MNPDSAVAIERLTALAAPRIVAHLLRLSAEDRSLRFAAALVTDETIRRYVSRIRFGLDAVFGLVDGRGWVVGLAHGCVFEVQAAPRIEAAFSIDADLRGLGFGHRLMQAVDTFAQHHGMVAVVGLCAARNLPMRRVFERAGMQLVREDDEVHAVRSLCTPEAAAGPVHSGRSGKLGRGQGG